MTTYILLALTHGDMPAAAIYRQIGNDSQSTFLPSEAPLYKALNRMLRENLIAKSVLSAPQRRIFTLTPNGRKQLKLEQARISRLSQVLHDQL